MPEWSEARGRTLVETCSSPVCKCSPKLVSSEPFLINKFGDAG
ncbi:9459_t:CDS:2 [Entrophospora sp. SA101]|nr:9459_t:CDS:2 [Entrophospora sp. SA101]